MNIRGAIMQQINGDATLVAMLDDYKTAKAIFSPVAPADYVPKVKPFVLVRRPTTLDDESPFGGAQSNSLVSVAFYGLFPPNSTDDAAVSAAALRARARFRGQSFTHDGILFQAVVSGPIPAPTETPNLVGELLQVRLIIGA